MHGQLPEFLGIGVQKGGTTTLQLLLEQVSTEQHRLEQRHRQ